ncbi:MAG: AraD1 family protein [Terriglobales bacterium]|jgi:hypothetical protein
MTRLLQLKKGNRRRVALVDEPRVRLLDTCSSIYELGQIAIATGMKLSEVARQRVGHDAVDMEYDPIYSGQSEWRLLPAIDRPEDPAHCLLSGTGLTHLGSARGRQSMHAGTAEDLTDSMKMFRWGVEGGRPAPGCIGTAPEWFHKGTGTALRAHGEPLDIPCYAEDGGEEAEIAGIYLVDRDGRPHRLGMAIGNEFSDHQIEKRNYLYLAGSKLRACALGPELVIDPDFDSVPVKTTIERDGGIHWSKTFRTGESEMCHNLQNIEHHHFKYEAHRWPGDIHVHFLGTDCLSYSDHIRLRDGDIMEVAVEGFGRPLRNPVRENKTPPVLTGAIALR